MMVPVLLLALLLTVSNIVLILNVPARGEPAPVAGLAAAAARLFGLFALTVAILRLLTGSARRPWRPDGAFWLYGLTMIAGFALSLAVGEAIGRAIGGDRTHPFNGLVVGVGVALISAPLAAWFTAIAVERPLAGRPGRWMRRWGRWLPHVLFWSILVIAPIGAVHAVIDGILMRGAGGWFWPLALFDGPFSVLIALGGSALAAEAYRRVARG
jgi:hypothetical protein